MAPKTPFRMESTLVTLSVLKFSIKHKKLDVIRHIMSIKPHVVNINYNGLSILREQIYKDNYEIIEILCDNVFNIYKQKGSDNKTLDICVQNNMDKYISLFLNKLKLIIPIYAFKSIFKKTILNKCENRVELISNMFINTIILSMLKYNLKNIILSKPIFLIFARLKDKGIIDIPNEIQIYYIMGNIIKIQFYENMLRILDNYVISYYELPELRITLKPIMRYVRKWFNKLNIVNLFNEYYCTNVFKYCNDLI